MLTYLSLTANLTFVAAVTYLELFVYCETVDNYFEFFVLADLTEPYTRSFLWGCVDLLQGQLTLF